MGRGVYSDVLSHFGEDRDPYAALMNLINRISSAIVNERTQKEWTWLSALFR